jgi:hypothetical protein
LHFSKSCHYGNYAFTWVKDKTGSTDLALYILSAVLFLGAVLVMRVPAKVVNR